MTIRTLLIGVDGATFSVLDALTRGDSALMPNLGALMRTGARATLRSTPNPLTPPAWVSLMTGRWPGGHGIHDFLRSQEVSNTLYTTLTSAADCHAEMIWSIASRQGRQIAALNFPFTAPPPKHINGVMLPGFVPWKHLRRNTHPREFYAALKESLPGFDPKQLAWDYEHEAKSVEAQEDESLTGWIDYHIARDDQWFAVAKQVGADLAPDLLAVMFDGTDKLQHQVWPFLEPGVDHDMEDEGHRVLREHSLRYFARLDSYIGELVKLAGPEAQIFIASDHGFTGQRGIFHANSFLEQRGDLEFLGEAEIEELRAKSSFLSPVNIGASRAYSRTPSTNGIFIRRRPDETDADYTAYRDALIADLLAVRDADGKPVITAVRTREEIFPGPGMDDAPDLTLTLRDSGFLSLRPSDEVWVPLDRPIGTHHPDGIFVAAGPGVRRGVKHAPLDIVDVAALLLYSIGLPVPEDFDGTLPETLFTEDWLAKHPVETGPATLPPDAAEAEEMSADDKAGLMSQLTALGYA